MKIIEIQESIHGEAPYQGSPCLIVRFKNCNLRCPYCDTKEKMLQEGTEYDIVTLTKEIVKHKLPVLFTGGEPLFDPHFETLLYQVACVKDIFCTIETNGTKPLVYESKPTVRYIADIKLHLGLGDILNSIQNCKRAHHIKFVYWNEKSLIEAVDIVTSKMLNPKRFIFSPMIKDTVSTNLVESGVSAITELKRQGYHCMLSLQMHKFINVP